jgi:ribonuclease G
LLKLFRRKAQTSTAPAPAEAAAPGARTDVTPPPPRGAAAGGAEVVLGPDGRPKRRRGTRGGRNRKKPGAAGAATAADAAAKPAEKAEKAEKAEPRKRTERKTAERKPAAKPRAERQTRRRAPPRRAPLPQAKRELLISVDVGEQRVAVLEDGVVAEVYLERPEKKSIAGNIYKGTVDNVLPGMEAAFIEIGLEKNGFLYVDEIVGAELEGRRKQERKIQDLIARGQEILVQAVKDPMKSKGARLTTDISLPGRFVVFVPLGEGLGVSRRLEDDERTRLKDIVKALKITEGGIIVRTAAEGASAEDIERDVVFLQKLWKTIQDRAKTTKAPNLVYQEAELPLRVTRDLFTGDFERLLVDHDRTHKRVVGYLKKTSPHMVERVTRYKEKPSLMEEFGVEKEIRSTLSRRVDLPSGGYLIFDYAEAFTVIDVNTGRFVGARGKSGGGRLEDTITKNNLEAVKEVVRQLRLRDIGGIIVIDFIDMANPKNRAAVEEALRTELERDRTKTYVVEISPLGLVEMTRQNVTDGPREILTRKCPTCAGDGIVYSDASVAVDVERKLRELAAKPRSKAFKVEVNARVAALIVPRLEELETLTKRRFLLVGKPDVHNDHFSLVEEGTYEQLKPEAPFEEGAELEVKPVEIGLYDATAGVAKLDGYAIVIGGGAKLVGKKVKVRIERVLEGVAYAVPADTPKDAGEPPITAEAEAEKPTRAVRSTVATKKLAAEKAEADAEAGEGDEAEELEEGTAEPAGSTPEAGAAGADSEESDAEAIDPDADPEAAAAEAARKKRRRGTRGGRGRKRKPAGAPADADADAEAAEGDEPAEPADVTAATDEAADGAGAKPATARKPRPRKTAAERAAEKAAAAEATTTDETTGEAAPRAASGPRIHVPDLEPGDEGSEDGAADGTPAGDAAAEAERKRRRRGTRGGRNRRKKPASAANGSEPGAEDDDAEGEDVEAVEAVEAENGAATETPAAETEEAPEAPRRVAAPVAQAAPEPASEPAGQDEDDPEFRYVPMSEWIDDIEGRG